MDARIPATLVVLLCMLAAVPWRFVQQGNDALFVVFALAPPLLLAAGLGWKNKDRIRSGL